MEKAERHLKHQQGFIFQAGALCRGNLSKRARAHCHTYAWGRYRGLVEKYQEGQKDTIAGQPRKISYS
jgi:hypothetical protein